MNATKIRLKFTAPLHIAARGVGYERVNWMVNSDTLYSAILTVWNYLRPGAAGQHAAEPPFCLSSAFPYLGDLEFYPKPLAPLSLHCPAGQEKAYARVQFIEKEPFEKLLQGEAVTFQQEHTRQNGKFWTGRPAPHADVPFFAEEQIFTEIETGRVVIDRVTNRGMNYFVSELHFAADAGLFFWIRFRDPALRQELLGVLRLLGEEGLGLDRYCGKGQFEIDEKDVSDQALPGPAAAERFLTLSLYHPKETEIAGGLIRDSAYELFHRAGFVSGYPYRRQTLTMFSEGSVFSGSPAQNYGDCPVVLDPGFQDSAIDHPVYRCGYAFPLGIQG